MSGEEVPGAINTGKTANVSYAVGSVEGTMSANSLRFINHCLNLFAGPIQLGKLELAGYTVNNQAFSTITLFFFGLAEQKLDDICSLWHSEWS